MEQEVNPAVEYNINNIPEPEKFSDVIYNLMVNPNLSPLNYFNDFSETIPDPKNMGNEDVDSSGIVELPDGTTLFSMTTHAMHHHLEIDPQIASEILVSRAARKMVCLGARPLAITAMLYHINFGDPNGHLIASGAKKGLENAAKTFNLKISDRKIRFDYFDEHGTQNPTIIVTLLGILDKKEQQSIKTMSSSFKMKGNNIFLIGKSIEDIASSEYLEFYHGISSSPLPMFNLNFEAKLQKLISSLIDNDLIRSACPVGKGGLFFTLLRSGWVNELGFDITTDAEIRTDAFLFGESMGRIIVGVSPEKEDEFVDFMYDSRVPFFTLGHVTKGEIRIDDESFGYIDKMSSNL
jgi:phosphoribosylformylglycinamidine synthase subunit PurL